MKLSHSKLETCINNPMDYYLSYKLGIQPKETKKCFQVGSAMHWGFEHGTEDLSQWFKENGDMLQQCGYSIEQEQAEAMCHGYFHNYDKIMDEVLKDYDTGERLEFADGEHEFHELSLTAKLPSAKDRSKSYDFIGIIDLLFVTKKGFIILDYKSSSEVPDFNKYLDQIYRYDFMLRQNFPGFPIYKIGIINIVKSKIKKMSNENDSEFRLRWKKQYEQYPNRLINVNMFDKSKLDDQLVNDYISNLSREADLANAIDENSLYYINYRGAKEPYKSVYYDIYYNEPYAYSMFSIKDTVIDPDTSLLSKKRDCVPSDMLVVRQDNVMCKFEECAKEKVEHMKMGKDEFDEYIHSKYVIDQSLLDLYDSTFGFVYEK